MKYRIVQSWVRNRYDVQWRWWWCPIWASEGKAFSSVEEAEEWVAEYKAGTARQGKVVKHL